MSQQSETAAILKRLPSVVSGAICSYHLDARGQVVSSSGIDESVQFELEADRLSVRTQPGRTGAVIRLVADEEWMAFTFDDSVAGDLLPFLQTLFSVLTEKELVELDMESMQTSSLALLEEVSMVGEMLPELPLGDTDNDVAEIGMSALLVASSVERVIFVRLDEPRCLAEVAAQIGPDDEGAPRTIPYQGNPFIVEGDNLVWRAARTAGGAILESVPADGHLGLPGSPESLAKNQVIAVPVRYGTIDKAVTLGVLLMMDKRKNAYSNQTHLGSQETKLASSVASMLGSVLGTRKVTELGNEMRMAHMLQQQILPEGPPQVAGFDLAGRCTTSGAVGGDYFDFLGLPDGRVMVVVADVSGHNLASGMIMVSARTTLRLLANSLEGPAPVFDALASSLFEDLTRTERFITAAAAAIEAGSSRIELVNAGHNPTMIYRAATGEIEEILGADTVLGFLPAPEHEVATLDLLPGDVALLYTDGVTEAVDAKGEMFEEERLRAVLREAATGSADEILESVFRAVTDFADKAEKGDDVSAVVIKAVAEPDHK